MNYKLILEKIEAAEKRITELEKSLDTLRAEHVNSTERIDVLSDLIKSAKPIKNIYNEVKGHWVRVYHTDENWLLQHQKEHNSAPTDEIIGFALTKNPQDCL